MTTLFTEWDVEADTLEDHFTLEQPAPEVNTISTDQASSGTKSIKFAAGGIASPGLMADLGAGHSTIYMRWNWYFSSTTDATAAGRHGFRLSQRLGDSYFSQHEFDTLPNGGAWGFDIIDHAGSYDSGTTFHEVVTLPEDVWFKFEILLILSSPGTANGTVKVWINDVEVFSDTAVQFVGSAGWTQFDTLAANTNWDSGTALWYYDDFYVSDTDESGSGEPPATPRRGSSLVGLG